ncbi:MULTISPECIES: sodium:calcium symporter [unclassified Lentimonas]|uniref:sodium:calcium symporter n=1 Tax=unclassified Lentimonas TaxID=2630993 RepID=UPI00132AE63C|nr:MULTISPECIES: sodium:calcium symporter [unclassified Lentimonas]CAA6678180.1 sodium/calcium exchanger membrane region [Lentimonas sp. CC4]CAA6685930.1 sodium/calcium exchanger membrane region [Lentimonas sp. CC6]CAA6691893.1 sodium/calcium exchanger membrane region [Lentimonas sp. CC19]CAA6694637.1 sodium/calcium exchanger membrane region [Lentimonas sp. CC10]CAA7072152.1 sodium/calcium exchanger membrane region [Lentimonas sp. CC11]
MELIQAQIEYFAGVWTPLALVGIFLVSSLLIIWRLEKMTHRGVEGTVLGTLFMPYFSGLGNLVFIAVVLKNKGPAEEVAINCWTNNITNLCLLLAVPALIWGLQLGSQSKAKKAQRDSKLHRLSLALTLVAMLFFSLMVWVLGQDGTIDRFDGFALVGLFLFWQCFHVYEVLKENTRSGSSWHPAIIIDLVLILIGSVLTLVSVDGIVTAIMNSESGFFSANQLGLLTGWLMVLPNAVLAFYYAYKRKADVVYSSQVGDGHICIPLCIGLYAIFQPMPLPDMFDIGLLLIAGAALLHLACIVIFRRLPKLIAVVMVGAYGYSLYWQFAG